MRAVLQENSKRKASASGGAPMSGESAGFFCFSVVIQLLTDCWVNFVGAGAFCAIDSAFSVIPSTSTYFRDGLSV